jgi:hypothetical protein
MLTRLIKNEGPDFVIPREVGWVLYPAWFWMSLLGTKVDSKKVLKCLAIDEAIHPWTEVEITPDVKGDIDSPRRHFRRPREGALVSVKSNLE